jgi:methylated-DNA-[protein]-cysteine S-methyltransferase
MIYPVGQMTRCFTQIESPLGPLLLAADDGGLREIRFVNGRHPTQPEPSWKEDRAPLSGTIQQLQAYFAGELESFDLQLAPMEKLSPTGNWLTESEIPKHPEPWASPMAPTQFLS